MARPSLARALAVSAAATVAVLGALPSALAQSPSFVIAWDAPSSECPDEAYVRHAIEQLLAGDGSAAPRVEARASVAYVAGAQWQVHLTTVREGATGERVFESSSCRSLADATALIVALTIDPQRVAANRSTAAPAQSATASAAPSALAPAPAASTAAPVPTTAPAPAPSVTAPVRRAAPAPEPPSPPLPASRVAVIAALSGDLGTLPRPAYGFTLGASLFFGDLRLEGYGAYWPSETAYAASSPSLSGDVQLADGGARGCWVPLHGALEIAACPGLELGVLHGQGKTVRSPRPNDGVWFAATALGRASWRIASNFGFFLDVGLAVPFWRDQFVLDDIGGRHQVHQAGPVEGRAALGPELRF